MSNNIPGSINSSVDIPKLEGEARKLRRQHPEYRWGQALFNALYEMNPELANHIRSSPCDPFYIDANVNAFYRCLQLN